jgi:hypothetical protein
MSGGAEHVKWSVDNVRANPDPSHCVSKEFGFSSNPTHFASFGIQFLSTSPESKFTKSKKFGFPSGRAA